MEGTEGGVGGRDGGEREKGGGRKIWREDKKG